MMVGGFKWDQGNIGLNGLSMQYNFKSLVKNKDMPQYKIRRLNTIRLVIHNLNKAAQISPDKNKFFIIDYNSYFFLLYK